MLALIVVFARFLRTLVRRFARRREPDADVALPR
jgi:hypothetical protein